MEDILPGSGVIAVTLVGTFEPMSPTYHDLINTPFPWGKCSVRVNNCFETIGRGTRKPTTFGGMLRFTRREAMGLRNLGKTCLDELDEVMDSFGLGEQWNNT